MITDKILYYPYINIPNNLWTSRALLYWDNIGVIVPMDFVYNPEKLESHMHDLVTAQLVEQIVPMNFTADLPNFKKGFLDIILSQKFNVNLKRKDFGRGKHLKIHVEKFDNGIMNVLEEIGLAKWKEWPWWNVEIETAKILMTYLASVISLIDKRRLLTDSIAANPKRFFALIAGKQDDKIKLRNRLLNDILPLPTKIKVSDLAKIKEKYSHELNRFRNNIETIILDISKFEDTGDFETYYKLQLDDIKDTKNYIAGKLSEPKFGKIVFGTLCGLSAAGIAVAQTPQEQFYWTIPSILNAVYTAIESHKRNDIIKKEPLSYLALVERKLKIE